MGGTTRKDRIQNKEICVRRMLRWMSGNIRKDGIQSEEIYLKIRVTLIDENM